MSKGKWTNKVIDKKEYQKLKREAKNYVHELKRMADKFLWEEYKMKLTVPLDVNGRLTSTNGYFKHYNAWDAPISISISERMIIVCSVFDRMDVVEDVLKHELVHYALYMQKRNHRDGDQDFESELLRLGISPSGVTPDSKVLSKRNNSQSRLYPIFISEDGETYPVQCGITRKTARIDGKEAKNTGSVQVSFYSESE